MHGRPRAWVSRARPRWYNAVAHNPRSGNLLVDEDPLGTGVGTVSCKPRHIECDSDDAGVVAHEPLDADCRNSSASSDVGNDSEARIEQVEVQLPGKASRAYAVRTTSMKSRIGAGCKLHDS